MEVDLQKDYFYANFLNLTNQFCKCDCLETYDPYDIWKTYLGFKVKRLFNKSQLIGALPGLVLSIYDQFLNNSLRFGYKVQEYAIVRALAVQTLLNIYRKSKCNKILSFAEKHLEWLKNNTSKGYSGACWGLGFEWAAFEDVVYNSNTPHTTHTPYALEAFHLYTKITGNTKYIELIRSCYEYYENDVKVMYEDSNMMAVSYGPFKDKIVINATSYTLLAYSIFLQYFPERKSYILDKISKLFSFISANQRKDGSWLYSLNDRPFIDCFHSCIIIKNLWKVKKTIKLLNIENVIYKGYLYIKTNFYNSKHILFKRFTLNNKFSLTRFDLYDNAEVLNLANMMNDVDLVLKLNASIKINFEVDNNIYSVIDFLGFRRNKNTLRWAVMPYLYSLSCIMNKS